MKTRFPSSGLYAITATAIWPGSSLVNAVSGALDGGACVIQYREKDRQPDVALATALLELCRSRQVPFIINDHIELAAQIDADGVHLGRSDCGLAEARQRIGGHAIVGISCYDSLDSAVRAEQEGADYVAFGSFFASRTKPDATPVQMEILKQAKFRIPVVAIGGITPENGRELLESGADLLAVISGIFGRSDPAQAAFDYAHLFANTPSRVNRKGSERRG